MKISIFVNENDQWVRYKDTNLTFRNVFVTVTSEVFVFDLIRGKAASIEAIKEHNYEKHKHMHFDLLKRGKTGYFLASLMHSSAAMENNFLDNVLCRCLIHVSFDTNELDVFLNNPFKIEETEEWLRNIFEREVKKHTWLKNTESEIERYALESFDKIKETIVEIDEIEDEDRDDALQMMTSIINANIQRISPPIFRDDLIIKVLNFLPKTLRKVTFSRLNSLELMLETAITDEDKNFEISNSKYFVTKASDELEKQYPTQFAVAKMFFEDKRWAECDSFEPEDLEILCKFMEEFNGRMYSSKFYEFREKELANEDRSAVLEFYKFYRAFVKKSKNIELPDVLDSDRCKNIEPPEIFELYKFYKTVAKDKNIETSDVLNTDFYKFYKEAESDKFEIY